MKDSAFSLEELFEVIKAKIDEKDQSSYTYCLAQKGVEKIGRKIGEEAVEVLIAGFLNERDNSQKTKSDLTSEICDLLYHTLVLTASQNIEYSEVINELKKRNKNERNNTK